jgi:uncharacterized protein
MRYLTPYITEDLASKMVFLSGPRQVGKTTLAKGILADHFPSGRYFNWDLGENRRDILKKRWDSENELLILMDL